MFVNMPLRIVIKLLIVTSILQLVRPTTTDDDTNDDQQERQRYLQHQRQFVQLQQLPFPRRLFHQYYVPFTSTIATTTPPPTLISSHTTRVTESPPNRHHIVLPSGTGSQILAAAHQQLPSASIFYSHLRQILDDHHQQPVTTAAPTAKCPDGGPSLAIECDPKHPWPACPPQSYCYATNSVDIGPYFCCPVWSSRGSSWRPTGPFYNYIPTPTDELIAADDDDDVDTPLTTSQSPSTSDGTIPPGTASPPPTAAALPTEIVLPTWNELRQLAGNWPTALAGFLDFVAPTFQSLANNATTTTTTTTTPSLLPTTAAAQPIYAVPIVVPYRNNKKVSRTESIESVQQKMIEDIIRKWMQHQHPQQEHNSTSSNLVE